MRYNKHFNIYYLFTLINTEKSGKIQNGTRIFEIRNLLRVHYANLNNYVLLTDYTVTVTLLFVLHVQGHSLFLLSDANI